MGKTCTRARGARGGRPHAPHWQHVRPASAHAWLDSARDQVILASSCPAGPGSCMRRCATCTGVCCAWGHSGGHAAVLQGWAALCFKQLVKCGVCFTLAIMPTGTMAACMLVQVASLSVRYDDVSPLNYGTEELQSVLRTLTPVAIMAVQLQLPAGPSSAAMSGSRRCGRLRMRG
jgi:hypothetical protein